MAALAHGGSAKLALAQLGRLVPEFTHEQVERQEVAGRLS
jgi:hypothetical protein